MNEYPLVSIITVNYNQSALTADMIESLQAIDYPNIEIIVVDNASDQDDVGWLAKAYPKIKLLFSSENLGFAGGNNLGIREARGKYFLFLNNDTTVEPDFLNPLVELCEKQPTIGMLGSQIEYAFYPGKIQFSGARLSRWTGRISWLNRNLTNQKDLVQKTDLVHGAAMFVPQQVIEKVGDMPEIYFLLYEEFDWCERIKKAGYDLYYVGASKIYHKVSMTMRKAPFKSYYMARNRLLFVRRNFEGWHFWSSLFFFLFLGLPKQLLAMLFRGEWSLVGASLRGLFWHCRPLPTHIPTFVNHQLIKQLKS